MPDEFDPTNLSVVFVDDDKVIVELFRWYVDSAHPKWRVQCFSDPIRALEYVKGYGSRIDVMVCDISMPFVSGIEMFELVRSKYPNIIRITLSGMIDSRTILGAGKNAEFNLCKPVKGEVLCAKILELVKARHDGTL